MLLEKKVTKLENAEQEKTDISESVGGDVKATTQESTLQFPIKLEPKKHRVINAYYLY